MHTIKPPQGPAHALPRAQRAERAWQAVSLIGGSTAALVQGLSRDTGQKMAKARSDIRKAYPTIDVDSLTWKQAAKLGTTISALNAAKVPVRK